MRVNVTELLAERDGVRVLAFAEPLPASGEDIAFAEPVTGEIKLTGAAGGISLRGLSELWRPRPRARGSRDTRMARALHRPHPRDSCAGAFSRAAGA